VQGATHIGVVEDPGDFGDSGQDIIADIALFAEDLFERVADVLVQGRGEGGLDQDIAVGDEALDLGVAEEGPGVDHIASAFIYAEDSKITGDDTNLTSFC
jgi:hypothetical protein